jgi:hypothetical protein
VSLVSLDFDLVPISSAFHRHLTFVFLDLEVISYVEQVYKQIFSLSTDGLVEAGAGIVSSDHVEVNILVYPVI